MNFPFRWIPAGDCREEPAQVLVLEMDQNQVFPVLSVQREWNKGIGIVRGATDPTTGDLLEDHTRERLGTKGGRIEVNEPIVGADNMRKCVWTVDEHVTRHLAVHPEHEVLAWVGNGNLLSNPHFVAFRRHNDESELFHLRDEEAHFGQGAGRRKYSCLVVRRDGYANPNAKVRIEDLHFWYANGRPEVYSIDEGGTVTDEVECATFGQRLVSNGKCTTPDELCQMAEQGQFYDLRHLLLFGRLPRGEKRWIDAGLSVFWRGTGSLNKTELVSALKGGATTVDVSQFTEKENGRKEVLKSLEGKGYVQSPHPNAVGQFKLDGGALSIVFKYGIYPHNMIGIREDGTVLSVVIRGLSNRVGVSVLDGAKIMQMLGARHAILIDNGGDVMMGYAGDTVLGSAEGERNRLRAIMMFVARKRVKNEIQPDQFRLLLFPKQYGT